MKERLEDLGRIQVHLEYILKEDIFEEWNRPRRCKDYDEWWDSLTEERKDEVLRLWVYGLEELEMKLNEILAIANGEED